MARTTITPAWMAREQSPGLYWDRRTLGLGVRVNKNRSKSFIYKHKNKRVTLGVMPLKQAQEKVRELAETGIAVGTVGEAFDLWEKRHLLDGKSPATVENRRKQLKKWLEWDMPLSRINHKYVQALQLRVGENSRWAANDVVRHLRTLYRVGTGSDWAVSVDPLRTSHLESNRTPFPGPTEFWAEMRPRSPEVRAAALMLALTGLRENEVFAARREHLKNGWLWVYNAKRSGRSGPKPFARHMATQVLDALTASESEWLFPGVGKTGHIADINASCGENAIKKYWRTTAELHVGAPFPVVAKLLNHSAKRGVTDVYLEEITPEMQEMWSQRIADYIAEKLGL